MNPRGRQHRLAGTIDGWVRLTEPTASQRRALAAAYLGLDPRVYSRYGRRQWAALLPRNRVVVKDPFALLSIPSILEITGAHALVVYRHPGAALVSYRRMGWTPDLDELAPIVSAFVDEHGLVTGVRPLQASDRDEVAAMAWFWNSLYGMMLADTVGMSRVTVVSHEALAMGGSPAAHRVLEELRLPWTEGVAKALGGSSGRGRVDEGRLHNFDRPPEQVATSWASKLSSVEADKIHALTLEVQDTLLVRDLLK